MNNSNQYDELLIKYLADDLNAEEKTFIENWIHASEQNRKYFEELKHVWQLAAVKQTLDQVLDEMNMEEKWNRFQQNVAAKETKVRPIYQLEEESVSEYGQEEQPDRKSVVYRLLVRVAIAASVLLVVGLGWKLLVQNKQEAPVAINHKKTVDSVLAIMRHEVNTTGKEKRIQLYDGSLIVLAAGSEIKYREPFINSRDITLIGKAYFKVAKDKTRPFTVISGDISTTALGTEFTVTTLKDHKRIIVRLYEGKVVVRPVDKANRKFKNDVYLLPGQEFVYGSKTTVKAKAFKLNNAAEPEDIINNELYRDDPSIPENAEGSWYMFNNESLGQVLNQLAGMYNVQIIYDQNDVENIYFTGKYSRSDSLQSILDQIGVLHNLKIIKKDSAFIISK
jgi:transmembrane sensor